MISGEHIKRIREARGMTQRELSQRAGVTGSLIPMIESGKRPNPEYGTALRIARALGVPLTDIDPDLTEADLPNAPRAATKNGLIDAPVVAAQGIAS